MKYFKKSKFSDNFNNKVGIVILHRKCFLERFDQFSMLKNDFENQNFAILKEVVHKFGKSDIIKKCLIPQDAYVVSCPTRTKNL